MAVASAITGAVEGQVVDVGIRLSQGCEENPPPDDPHTGAPPTTLFSQMAPGSRATSTLAVSVTGRPYHGSLSNLGGTQVTASPVVYGSDGYPGGSGQQAFIVDFGVSLSVLRLELTASGNPHIVLVLPWVGTDFSPKSAYPASFAQTPLPIPDATGSPCIPLTGVEGTKLLVQVTGSGLSPDGFAAGCRITTGTWPSNVKASLNGRLPFWTKGGPLRDTQTLTGLVEDLNVALGGLTKPTDIVLELTTDTPGVIQVNPTIPPGATVETAEARWGGQSTTQVPVGALVATSVVIPFPTDAAAAEAWQIGRLSLQLSGAFPPWRAFPDPDAPEGDLGMVVDANFSVARRIVFLQAGQLFGFSIPARVSSGVAAQLHLEVQPDQNGVPAGAKPLNSADMNIPASAGPAWTDALFASPAAVKAGAAIWLVVKAKTGAVEWVGTSDPASSGTPAVFSAQGGPWEAYPSLDAGPPQPQVRVLRRPFPAENAPLLDLSWSAPPGPAGASVSTDASAATATVELGPPTGVATPQDGAVSVVLSVTARAPGTLTLKGASVTYTAAGGSDG